MDFLLPSAHGTLPARVAALQSDDSGNEQLQATVKSRTLPSTNGPALLAARTHAHERSRDQLNHSPTAHLRDVTEDRTLSGKLSFCVRSGIVLTLIDMRQGLRNGTASVCLSVCLSAAGLLLSTVPAGDIEAFSSIIHTYFRSFDYLRYLSHTHIRLTALCPGPPG